MVCSVWISERTSDILWFFHRIIGMVRYYCGKQILVLESRERESHQGKNTHICIFMSFTFPPNQHRINDVFRDIKNSNMSLSGNIRVFLNSKRKKNWMATLVWFLEPWNNPKQLTEEAGDASWQLQAFIGDSQGGGVICHAACTPKREVSMLVPVSSLLFIQFRTPGPESGSVTVIRSFYIS